MAQAGNPHHDRKAPPTGAPPSGGGARKPSRGPSWRTALLDWYRSHKRDLPWRRTSDVYAIWVSEVMLQQTQVATVLPYYERWMRRFPTLDALAKADEQDVLAVWQGMGYYRRAKMLLAGAKWAAEHGVPKGYQDWLLVPGVGPYTAAAVASIAQGVPAAVVDGNVERVFSRVAACGETGPALLREARRWAAEVLDRLNPGDWNQALMELGATICTPREPKCGRCPLETSCIARQSWSTDRFPARAEKPKIVREQHTVWVPYLDGRFGVVQIPAGQWWAGMWEFPRSSSRDEQELREAVGEGWLEALGTVRHHVTHHRIVIEASLVRSEKASEKLVWRTGSELEGLPMPSPQRKVLAIAKRALGLV